MTEKLKSTIENTGEVLESAREQLTDNIENKLERARNEKEKSAESKEDIRNEALEIASKHEAAQEKKARESKENKKDQPSLTKADVEASYKKTLDNVQKQLPAPSRAFSKVIHNSAVEKTSDAIGNTIARPNLIIAGALGAIASIIVYLIAKKYGYVLSGSETIVLFAAGWCIGAIIEYGRVGLINKQKR